MALVAPRLLPIDPEMLLFGKIHLIWSDVRAAIYYIYRDYEPIKNILGWQPYAVVEEGKTNFDDGDFENKRTYYYAICAVSEDGTIKSDLSNCEKIRVSIPPNLIVNNHQVEEAAYYESQRENQYEEKIRVLARTILIIKKTFPNSSLEFLKNVVKSLKKNLPNFNGLFYEPTETEIQEKMQELNKRNLTRMELDWQISEHKLVMKKLSDLIEYENEIR